jgi:hypothetical protein
LYVRGLWSRFNCPVLGHFLNFSVLRFNSNDSFEFLYFKMLGSVMQWRGFFHFRKSLESVAFNVSFEALNSSVL